MSIKTPTTTINLRPYLGRSKHLIDIFFILGYDEKSLLELSPNILENEKDLEITILSNIISDSSLKVKKDEIIKGIYPEKPKIIKIDKSEIQNNISSSINSFCINGEVGNTKIFYSSYALKFYEKFIDSKNEYYMPKAFVIISEYPYFTTFHVICMYLYKTKIENNKSLIPTEIFLSFLLNYTPSPLKNKISLKIFGNDSSMNIPRLTGYPYLEFNLCNLLYSMPIKEFLKIYILVFLGISLLFFSKDLEKLNLIMFMIMNLNYPLVDDIYLWHIKTFSQKQLENGFDINQNTFRGINSEFNWKLNLSNFSNLYYIVHLSNSKYQLISLKNSNKEKEDINKILEYMNLIFKKNSKPVKSYFLAESLTTLRNKLKKIRVDYNEKFNKQKCPNFYIDNFINKKNREIQDAFYDFNLKIIGVLYEFFEFDYIKHNNPKFSEEENILFKYLSYSDKYMFYFKDFIKDFIFFEEYNNSYLFSDECANLKMYDIKNDKKKFENIEYLKIIDDLYNLKKNTEVIDYNLIYEEYNKFNEQYKDKEKHKENFIKSSQLFVLDKNIINEFLFNSKNRGLLESLKLKEKLEMKMDDIDKTLISWTIQKHLFKTLDKEDFYNLIIYSIIYIFSITFPILPIAKLYIYLTNILNHLKDINFFQRYYIYIILRSVYQFYSNNRGKRHFEELSYNICIKIKDYLKNNSIIKNEDISLILNNILSELMDKQCICVTKGNDIEKDDFFNKYENLEIKNNIKEINNDIIKNIENSISIEVGGANIKCNLLSDEFKILEQAYSVFYEYSKANFDFINFENNKIIEIIIKIIYYLLDPKYDDKEEAFSLYEILNIMIIFISDIKKNKENKNEIKEEIKK